MTLPAGENLRTPDGIDGDPNKRALVQVIDERFTAVPVQAVLVWHVDTVIEAALPHLAEGFGLRRIKWIAGLPPRALLKEGVAIMRALGTVAVCRKALDALGYAEQYEIVESKKLLLDGTWYLDGSYLLDGGPWYVARLLIGREEPLSEAAVAELWDVLNFVKPESRRWEIVAVLPGGELHTYRDGSLEPTISDSDHGIFDYTFDDTFG